ncbi:MAG: DUF6084 family protein [Mycobacterium sp.]
MSTVSFGVLDIAPEPYAVTPVLAARIGVSSSTDAPVHAIALRAQVRIEPARRTYSDDEAAGLLDLFGPRQRWSDTQRSFLWMHTSTMVPGFTGATQVTLPLECTYDFDVAAAKYLHALRDYAVPLQFLFSGTIFVSGTGGFAVQQVSWDRDDRYDLPVQVWRDLMSRHYPDRGWVRLGHDTMSALASFRSSRGLLDLDSAVHVLLDQSGGDPP